MKVLAPFKRNLFEMVVIPSVILLVLMGTQALAIGAPSEGTLPMLQQDGGQVKIRVDIAEFPLSFIANAGQIDANVQFMVKAGKQTVFFTSEEVVFAASEGTGDEGSRGSVVRLRFAKANGKARVEGENPLSGVANFFLGNDPEKWRTNVPTYEAITYHDLYPGIDLIYSGNQGQLKSEFVVAAGADPTVIIMDYSGVSSMYVREDGALVLETPNGELVEEAPLIYQMINAKRVSIQGGYRLLGEGKVTFALGEYSLAAPLIIDPELVYSTYLGGTGSDRGYSIVTDDAGNAYITGYTRSSNFPTQNPLQRDHGGGDYDAFVAKLNTSGNVLVYSTYLGGSDGDCGKGIALDSSGNIYITGDTASADFPTQNPLQANCRGHSDVFVAKLNPSGSELIYSTYLGGSSYEESYGVAVDDLGNAYITGYTRSTNFPTQNPLQRDHGGGDYDAFVAKLNTNGNALVYSTYLGGSGHEESHGITVDAARNAYITGDTSSPDFPTQNPLQPNHSGGGGGYQDAFVAKLNPSGSALVYSTYLGGSSGDFGMGIAVDGSGSAYITGSTASADFPTQNPLQANCRGNYDVFVAKLNPSGSELIYSTYLGGSGHEESHGITVDAARNAYITGDTSSPDFPTQNPLQANWGGNSDAFVAKLNAAGSALIYSTYLGGSGGDYGTNITGDYGYSIAVGGLGNAYITGVTSSSDFPTQNPLQPNYGGVYSDAFVAKISEANGQVVDFPDPNLEQVIREAINKPTGDIYQSDLVGLTSLDARGRNISNLEGIQYCVDLTTLLLNNNQISGIASVAGLSNLTILELGGNQIGDITALAGLSSLTSLDLIYNQISDITALGGLINLETLILVDNQITDITALSGLINLSDVALAQNQIIYINSPSGLINLTSLDLGENQISDINPLSGLTNLTDLRLYTNQISDINPLSGLTNLTSLDLSQDQIVDINPLSGLTSLTRLVLGENQINNIDSLSALTNLTDLELGENQIVDINPLSGLTYLTSLDLDENKVNDVSVLSGLTSLTWLYLSSNQIGDISALSDLTNLMGLYLGSNEITDISALSDLTNLTQLLLEVNQISDIQLLVDNPGLATGDNVDIRHNYLDLTPESHDMQNIDALIDCGVLVAYDPQNHPSEVMTALLSPGGWHMITLPGALCGTCAEGGAGDLVCALGDDLDPCYIFHYDPTTGGYVMAPPPENIRYHAGMGFWVRTYADNVTIDAEVQVPTEAVETTLGNGWNQIGNPFTFSVAASDLRVRCGDTELSLLDAQAQGWVSAYLFGYDTASGGYVMLDPTTGCLQPWNGYWMRSYQDGCVLIIPPTECSSSSPAGQPLNAKELQARGLELPPTPPNDLMNLDVKEVLAGLTVRNVPNPIRSEHTTTFKVEGKGAELVQAIRVDIYDLSCHKVFAQDINSKELEWHTNNETGELLANGVYLYQVWVKIADTWYPTGIRKLAVVR